MPILGKCIKCDRVGRYAEKETDKVCAKCKKGLFQPKAGVKEEEEENE